MNSEIIQSVADDNYDLFSTCQLQIFIKNSFHYFWGLFNDKMDLRVRYIYIYCGQLFNIWLPVSAKLNW